jgi:hypothetical protein
MGTCGPSLSVTIEQPASSPPQPVENGVFVAPMLPSPPPLSSELSPSFLREQIVERTVRQHEAAHAPLVQDAMRPREQPALSRVSVTFWTRMEVAGRGALAAVAAGGLHVLMQDQLAVLIIAVALLCSSANVGTSLKLSTHSVLGAVLSVPLAWLALGFMGVAPLEAAHAPACAALLGVVCAGVGYLQLPAVTRKVCLAGLALGVLLQRDAALGAALPALLALVGAVAQGALCALLSVLVPWPCLATREADARLRSAAAGAVLLLDGVLGQLGDGSGGARHWRPHTERVLSASRAELAGLPAVLEAAAWQPQLCGHRRATAWRAAQHESLVALDEGHAVLQETLHAMHSAAPAALSQQLLARVRPELGPLVECARFFAAQVAGGGRPRSAELLARRCDGHLLRPLLLRLLLHRHPHARGVLGR